jgi:hypothetical protein
MESPESLLDSKEQIPKLLGLSGTASDKLKDFVTAAPIPGSYLSNSYRIA